VSKKPLHSDPDVITPQQREEIISLGHEHIHERGGEFEGNWPTFRCGRCQGMSLGGEHWKMGESAKTPDKKALYLACSNEECKAVYHAQIQLLEIGTWMTSEELDAEGETPQ
jgi:hypothetical protein